MRRFTYDNRSRLFTHTGYENVTEKRAFFGTEKEFNFAMRAAFLLRFTATAGFIFGMYKAVHYIDNALYNRLEKHGPIFGNQKEGPIRPV